MSEAVVRRLSATLLAGAVLATAASGSTVDARLLVLQKSDVPAGFRLDGHSSGYWPNAAFARRDQQLRKIVTTSGRISGYAATYERGAATILSAAHLCRRSTGAHVLFLAEDANQRSLNAERVKRGGRAYRHRPVAVGDEASSYWSTQSPNFTLVLWRAGRVVGSISTWGLGRERTVALARVQHRRIEKTLG